MAITDEKVAFQATRFSIRITQKLFRIGTFLVTCRISSHLQARYMWFIPCIYVKSSWLCNHLILSWHVFFCQKDATPTQFPKVFKVGGFSVPVDILTPVEPEVDSIRSTCCTAMGLSRFRGTKGFPPFLAVHWAEIHPRTVGRALDQRSWLADVAKHFAGMWNHMKSARLQDISSQKQNLQELAIWKQCLIHLDLQVNLWQAG